LWCCAWLCSWCCAWSCASCCAFMVVLAVGFATAAGLFGGVAPETKSTLPISFCLRLSHAGLTPAASARATNQMERRVEIDFVQRPLPATRQTGTPRLVGARNPLVPTDPGIWGAVNVTSSECGCGGTGSAVEWLSAEIRFHRPVA